MASSALKRVVLYRFDRQPAEGIVNPFEYLGPNGIELITAGGSLQNVPFTEAKALCFASEPGRYDLFNDQNLFERRPKMNGLWTRFTFRDGDQLDGLLPSSLLEWPKAGFALTPPRSGAMRQRVFVPREALTETLFFGLIGAAVSRGADRKRVPGQTAADQLRMFDR